MNGAVSIEPESPFAVFRGVVIPDEASKGAVIRTAVIGTVCLTLLILGIIFIPGRVRDARDQGYPLCHFIDYLLKNKKSLTFGELLTAYGDAGGFTPTLKKAFDMDDKELTKQYKKFIKARQTNFYELALQWYTGENAGNQWALSRKGFAKQGEHAVIRNQAYQTTVRKIYPQIPPDSRQKQVSVLLAYDENYKELTDFELITIGNKNYKNTKYGIMYDPKVYSTMKDLYTLEIDGGANTEDVISGYMYGRCLLQSR